MSLCSHAGQGLAWLTQVVEGAGASGAGASGNWAMELALRKRVIVSSAEGFITCFIQRRRPEGSGTDKCPSSYSLKNVTAILRRSSPTACSLRQLSACSWQRWKLFILVERSREYGRQRTSELELRSQCDHAGETPRERAPHRQSVGGILRNGHRHRRRSTRIGFG